VATSTASICEDANHPIEDLSALTRKLIIVLEAMSTQVHYILSLSQFEADEHCKFAGWDR